MIPGVGPMELFLLAAVAVAVIVVKKLDRE